MRYFILCILCLVLTLSSMAQWKPVFRSKLNIGLAAGEKGSELTLNSVNGFKLNTWFAGVGVGLDHYRYRTVPLFLSFQKDLNKQPSTFFMFLDGGTHFLWDDVKENEWVQRDFQPSLYTATGLGYRLGWKNRREALLLNAGYSFKRLKEKQMVTNPCLVPPCPQSIERYQYDLNTWIMRIGFEF